MTFRDSGRARARAYFFISSCLGGWGRMPQVSWPWPVALGPCGVASLHHSHPVTRARKVKASDEKGGAVRLPFRPRPASALGFTRSRALTGACRRGRWCALRG